MRVREARPADAAAVATVQVLGWQAAYRGQVPDDYLDALDVSERERGGAIALKRSGGIL